MAEQDPYAAIAVQDDPYASVAEGAPAETTPTKPGVVKRGLKSYGQQVGIPTSKEELKAMAPSRTDEVGMLLAPGVYQAGKIGVDYVKNLIEQGKTSMKEAGEAGANIAEGGSVLQNAGKATAAGSDLFFLSLIHI